MLINTLDTTVSGAAEPHLQALWALLKASYAQVAGGLHYASAEALLEQTPHWRLALHDGQLVAAAVYKAKKGLKLSALGIADSYREVGRAGLQQILREDLGHSWMEVSEGAERFVFKTCEAQRYLIPNSQVPELLERDDIEPAADGFHYYRRICGLHKRKIALGTPCLLA